MNTIIRKSEVSGILRAPPSKSITHRALVCSSLANGKSIIITPLLCDDTEATIDALQLLGINIIKKENKIFVEGNTLKQPEREIFCRNSGTTLRFITAIASLVGEECRITGSSSLMQRPIEPLLNALRSLGVRCGKNGDIIYVKGKPVGGEVNIEGNISSQFISAMLLIAPIIREKVLIKCSNIESKPYIDLTIDVQKKFGVEVKESNMFEIFPQEYRSTKFEVEGDWSSASNILVAGTLCGKVRVEGLNLKSLQADKKIFEILRNMDAKIWAGENMITAERSSLEPIEVDISDCPDLFPPLCTLCSQAKGTSIIYGVKRLKFKESNRLYVMKENLERMNIRCEVGENFFKIFGSKAFGAKIEPYNDHRVAMALATLALVAEGETTILDAKCVEKSFPEFWKVMMNLGANIRVIS
ncbi:MAG: 3-phosphoshikimate 1-carboxyvinyltransferase [Nitrososphaeria archaeon]|nr:3-phosphoshikimate 1-carboxyvinyltransferase [Nitrososphaeria archaeon]